MLKISNANCSPQDLFSIFSKYGDIRVNIVRGHAIIAFQDEPTASRAMASYNNFMLNKRRLQVKAYKGEMEDEEDEVPEEESCGGSGREGRAGVRGKIREFKGKMEGVLKQRADELEQGLKATLEDMIREGTSVGEQNKKLELYNQLFDKQSRRVLEKLQLSLSSMAKHMNTFDKRTIDVQTPIQVALPARKPFSFQTTKLLQPRKPFFTTNNCGPVKRLLQVTSNNFIAAFSGTQCCKLYQLSDFKPHNSANTNMPSSLACYNKNDRYYCLVGDSTGRLGCIKLNPFEKQYDDFTLHRTMITDIKLHSENRFVSCSTDGYIKNWKAEEEERMPNDFSLEVTKTDEWLGEGRIASMDVMNQLELVLGLSDGKTTVMPMLKGRTVGSMAHEFPVLKVVKDTNKTFWACVNTKMKLIDSRSAGDNIVFQNFGEKLRALLKLSDNIICFGGEKRVGLADKRVNKVPLWKDDDVHKMEVRDIISMGTTIVTCSIDANIVKWQAS